MSRQRYNTTRRTNPAWRISCPKGKCTLDTRRSDLCKACEAAYQYQMKLSSQERKMQGFKPTQLPEPEYAHSLKEIGQEMGISKERVRQIEEEALAKIHNSKRRRKLLADYI